MNKNIIIGIAALGGLILIGTILPDSTTEAPEAIIDESSTALPSTVTASFPIYPHAIVVNNTESTSDDGRTSYSFSLSAESGISEINDWYREAMSQGGWSIKSDRNVAGYQIIQAEKDNLYTSMQAARGSGPDTAIISQQAQIRP